MSETAESEWPADPMDPRCPACDGPVSATADYCMHCQSDLPGADAGTARVGETARDAATTTTESATTTPATTADPHWAAGLLDDSLTITVGVVVGAVVGALVATALVFALPGGWPFLAGAAAWVASTVAIARSSTVFGGVRTAGYLLAQVLFAIPLTVSLTAPMADPGGSRLEFAIVLAIFAWPVAAALALVGRWIGDRGGGQ